MFFKLLALIDSSRCVRPYPCTILFASSDLKASGHPDTPDDLTANTCIGFGPWKLSRSGKPRRDHHIQGNYKRPTGCVITCDFRVRHWRRTAMDGGLEDLVLTQSGSVLCGLTCFV